MKTCVSLVTAILLVLGGLAGPAPAASVGRLTQVEGRVDLLKGGKLPAAAAKLGDPVEQGDVLRTKSLSKAQITFVDDTVITVSPESRIAIEEYMFDSSKGKRNAVLQLFQGMALAVVSKIFKVEQPDFILKTNTAVMGVRGTQVGIRLGPNDSTFLNFQGLTRVANIFPEVSGDLFRKAAKVAYSFGKGYVDLTDMQGTTVARGLPPTVPYGLTDEDRQMFMRQLVVNMVSSRGGKGVIPTTYQASGTTTTAGTGDIGTIAETVFPGGIASTGGMNPIAILPAGIYIPPKVVPPLPPGPPHPPR
ncbi:MAG TPA: FecR family protein [Desulfobaccales bacterium]